VLDEARDAITVSRRGGLAIAAWSLHDASKTVRGIENA
jgi:hypothetical protein